MAFENLNSLEILNLQNNKLTRVPEEALEAIVDTATVIDIMGKSVFVRPTLTPTHSHADQHTQQSNQQFSLFQTNTNI